MTTPASNVPAFAVMAELMLLLERRGLVAAVDLDQVLDDAGHRVANVPAALDAVALMGNILRAYRDRPLR